MVGDRGESTSAGPACAGAIAGPEAKMIHRSKPEIENNLWVRNIASNNHNKKQRVAARTGLGSVSRAVASWRARQKPPDLPAKQRSTPIPPRFPQPLR